MSAIAETEFDRNLRPRERNRAFQKLALRRRSQQHPMALFVLVVVTAFSAMTLAPPTGGGLASMDRSAVMSSPEVAQGFAGMADVHQPYRSDAACHGQAWGAETVDCLATIARDSGIDSRKIRVIAGA